MHFICSTFGSSGDVFPLFGLALELRRRGHAVTFATNEHFAGMAAEHGLPFEPLGTEADFAASLGNPDLWHPLRSFRHVFESVRPELRRQYQLHVDMARSRDVAAITNCFGFGAFNARDTHHLPVITLQLQPAAFWSDRVPPLLPGVFGPRWLKGLLYRFGERFVLDPIMRPFLNDWRAELGLPPIRHVAQWWNSPDGILCMFPDWYAPPQPDWPGPRMQTDFPLWNHRSHVGLAEDVLDFLGRGPPPIVFAVGTMNLHGRRFFESAVQVCRMLDRRGILLTEFPAQLPSRLPASVAHFRYVPLDLLLPRAVAFVHHAGIGSTSQGILAGIPQLVTPMAYDQFDNADRIKRLGIGDWIAMKRLSPSRLCERLKPLLESPAVASACREVAQRSARRDGLNRSADAIERCVSERMTVCGGRRA